CESERKPEVERAYLPLTMKLLLVLYGVDIVATAIVAGIGLVRVVSHPHSSLVLPLVILRLLLAVAAGLGLLLRKRLGIVLGLAFLSLEIVGVLMGMVHLMDSTYWGQPGISILWSTLFLFLLLRDEVRAYFDPRFADRKEVLDLLQSVGRDRGRE
ncbi:MAG TPA: hypothetical protein VKA63_11860, partial [Candidatus Krumholzibacteria bacterium]|nr:hypothetical protein [Candidatus Krumholzibacteria bacterium]